MFGNAFRRQFQRVPKRQALHLSLELAGVPCRWHPEQCTLAEFSCYMVRDVIAHICLAAEARVGTPRKTAEGEASEDNSDSDSPTTRRRPAMEIAGVGGGDIEAADGLPGQCPAE